MQRKVLENYTEFTKKNPRRNMNRRNSVTNVFVAVGIASSSYCTMKYTSTPSTSSPAELFSQYIVINDVEYKVLTYVPKHPPPDINPPPSLPYNGKQRLTTASVQIATEIQDHQGYHY